MKALEKLTTVLGLPVGYRLFRELIGGEQVFRAHLDNFVRPALDEKVLDIGCGPGDMVSYLPQTNYLGVDISPQYVEAAKKRFGNRGRFCCSDIGSFGLNGEEGTFDLVLATGVVHHLDDRLASGLFELAARALRPSGRLVTFDGCFEPGQSNVARWILRHDRGKFVRNRPDYERLAETAFSSVQSHVRHDLLRIPYTHLIMICTN
jgi:SAM-dependent methyltransferase